MKPYEAAELDKLMLRIQNQAFQDKLMLPIQNQTH